MKLGPRAPTYHIVLTGTDGQDKPVHEMIDTQLPPDPAAIPRHCRPLPYWYGPLCV